MDFSFVELPVTGLDSVAAFDSALQITIDFCRCPEARVVTAPEKIRTVATSLHIQPETCRLVPRQAPSQRGGRSRGGPVSFLSGGQGAGQPFDPKSSVQRPAVPPAVPLPRSAAPAAG